MWLAVLEGFGSIRECADSSSFAVLINKRECSLISIVDNMRLNNFTVYILAEIYVYIVSYILYCLIT